MRPRATAKQAAACFAVVLAHLALISFVVITCPGLGVVINFYLLCGVFGFFGAFAGAALLVALHGEKLFSKRFPLIRAILFPIAGAAAGVALLFLCSYLGG